MKNDLILVVGASGTVGSEVVSLLKSTGYRVRTTTSKPVSNLDVDKVHLNLATGDGIKHAFSGVDRAFFLSPPGYSDQYMILAPLIQEAKRQGLKKVVLMTAMGANAVESSPFRRAEIDLEKSGLRYNIIRPNWFLQKFNTFWIQDIREQKKILLPVGQAKVSFIDARDISAVAVKLLTDDSNFNQAFDLTGPAAVDHDEVAYAISQATGKKITYQEIQPAVLKKGLLTAGLPSDYVDFLLLILGFLREGYNATVNSNVRDILGRDAKTLAQYSQHYKQNWN